MLRVPTPHLPLLKLSILTESSLDGRMFYMGTLIISALSTACILSAVEAFIFSMGKWRGLLGLILNTIFCLTLDVRLRFMVPYVLGATFVGLTLSLLVEQIFTGVPKGDLPKRIPPR